MYMASIDELFEQKASDRDKAHNKLINALTKGDLTYDQLAKSPAFEGVPKKLKKDLKEIADLVKTDPEAAKIRQRAIRMEMLHTPGVEKEAAKQFKQKRLERPDVQETREFKKIAEEARKIDPPKATKAKSGALRDVLKKGGRRLASTLPLAGAAATFLAASPEASALERAGQAASEEALGLLGPLEPSEMGSGELPEEEMQKREEFNRRRLALEKLSGE